MVEAYVEARGTGVAFGGGARVPTWGLSQGLERIWMLAGTLSGMFEW